MGFKLNLGQIITLGQFVPGIVTGVQRIFGKESGAAKKAAAMQAGRDAIALIEGVSGKDLVNDEKALSLLSRMIEIGVQQRKLAEEMAQLDDQFRALREVDSSSAPDATGFPN